MTMTMRVHVERLVLDPRALTPEQLPHFRAALSEALARPHSSTVVPPPRPFDPVIRLAERTATAIQQHVVRR
jgi:hypothetical protein